MARAELRKAQRYSLSLPVTIHNAGDADPAARNCTTRDISTQGVYFVGESDLRSGSEVNLTMTIPAELTRGTDVLIKVTGKVVRIEDSLENNSDRIGVAAKIDRYEIVRAM